VSEATWRIDDLAHRAEVTVDTIRFYQREHLMPPAEKVGRTKLYGPEHLVRLERIRELQKRRFSLAAIRALLEAERPGLDDIFTTDGEQQYTLDDLVERSGIPESLVAAIRRAGLLRDPLDFGREGYDAVDLDLVNAVAAIHEFGMPTPMISELGRIYAEGVEAMQRQVVDLIAAPHLAGIDDARLDELQHHLAGSAAHLLPLVTRMVEYVHRRTLQRLTLGAIKRVQAEQREAEPDDAPDDAPEGA